MDSRQWGVLLIVLAAFSAGWTVNSWRRDSVEKVANDVAQQVADKAFSRESLIDKTVARALEDKLASLKANEVHTEREIRHEVVKPVFSTVCASDEYVRLFNAAIARDEAILSGVSGKPVDRVPPDAAAPDR
ncbi:hypothetical protein ACOGYG_002581 [Edwardsiella piscicida]|uniref:hypothetical protein n=1 Tax=Edwardsiella piscicida TaxID=1263550 RepID=UPI0002C144FD|nr:hypothetical protein [Edwardsiella piscicida]AGH72562.1 phage-like protein [Edwardsiella piscicida C07-087]EKS7779973.1 hypothetical protein [Edwardsiella piscicida]